MNKMLVEINQNSQIFKYSDAYISEQLDKLQKEKFERDRRTINIKRSRY